MSDFEFRFLVTTGRPRRKRLIGGVGLWLRLAGPFRKHRGGRVTRIQGWRRLIG